MPDALSAWPLTRRAFVALLAGSAGAALPWPGVAQTPRRGGVLQVAAPTNPSSLDPMTGGSGQDHAFLYPMFDTLVGFEPATLTAQPGLAESWRFPDPARLVLIIRQGVVFHDGEPLDAAAVKFNLDRNRQDPRSNIKSDLATVDAVETTGPFEVTLKLKQPDAALPLILSDRAGMMVSPKAAQALGKDFDRKPVGAGPWKLVTWADNDRVTVTRHERYWRPGQPWLDGIEIAIIPETNTGLRSVVAGQNAFVYFLSPQQKAVIDRAKSLTPVTGPTLYCVQLFFNFGRKPFDDRRVRRAFNLAIDREAFNKATMGGLGEPASALLPRAHWARDNTSAPYPYDPEAARGLLKEAGYDGLDLALLGYSDERSKQRQEVLVEQLSKAGMRLRFQLGSIPEISAAFFAEKKGDGLLAAWTGRPDPSLAYQLMFAKDSYYNVGRAEPEPALTAAILASRANEDPAVRKPAFAEAQRLVAEQALFAPLVFQPELDALSGKVKGYVPNLLGKPRYDQVWLEG